MKLLLLLVLLGVGVYLYYYPPAFISSFIDTVTNFVDPYISPITGFVSGLTGNLFGPSIKQLHDNPSSYYNQSLTVKGYLQMTTEDLLLVDSNGIGLKLVDNGDATAKWTDCLGEGDSAFSAGCQATVTGVFNEDGLTVQSVT